MSLRCHFNAEGWLTGPIGISHHMTPNRLDSGFAARAQGVVQHTEDGFEAGTFATFMDPGSQVSASFSVSEAGDAHQYLPVGCGLVAWAQADGNPGWYSCECEDKLRSGTPLTDAQLTAFAQIYSALAERDGFGYAVTDDTSGGRGLITHGDGGNAWGGHPDCPGPVRRAQRREILARARAVRDGLDIWIGQGAKSLNDLAADKLGNPVHQVLQLTAEYSLGGLFSPAMASYLNAVFAADAQPVPGGAVLFCPKQGGGITQFTSPGDQSLRALAQAHATQCSSVVRATAENSPGGTFTADVATYLDMVFAASATHIPQGTCLFYREQ